MKTDYESEWTNLTEQQKKHKLYEKQKVMLGEFLKRGAISKEQYDFGLNGLKSKMEISDENNPLI